VNSVSPGLVVATLRRIALYPCQSTLSKVSWKIVGGSKVPSFFLGVPIMSKTYGFSGPCGFGPDHMGSLLS
jgi:hypothetical protein